MKQKIDKKTIRVADNFCRAILDNVKALKDLSTDLNISALTEESDLIISICNDLNQEVSNYLSYLQKKQENYVNRTGKKRAS